MSLAVIRATNFTANTQAITALKRMMQLSEDIIRAIVVVREEEEAAVS